MESRLSDQYVWNKEGMKELKKIQNESEIEEFVRLFKGKSYNIESDSNGNLLKVVTDDKTIQDHVKLRGLVE
jgi:hypothetical protein